MATPVLILGESGTGKSTSLRNFKKGEIAIVNVAGKMLPFKANDEFEMLSGTTDYDKISKFMKQTKAKSIVIDDAQYIMSFQYMRRIKENGWDKFNDLQSDFFNLIDLCKELPNDVIVYFLSHIETRDDGRQKIKTIGKMLDEKITIEGMFTVVLKTHVSDGKYMFVTQNSGMDTIKSPIGMFNTYAIDNDLKYVDDKIRNFCHLGEFKTDEEMQKEDAAFERPEVEKVSAGGRTKRSRRNKAETEAAPSDDGPGSEYEENSGEIREEPTRRSRRKNEAETASTSETEAAEMTDEIDDDDVPLYSSAELAQKSRKERENTETCATSENASERAEDDESNASSETTTRRRRRRD